MVCAAVSDAFVPINVAAVVAKFESLPNAVTSSFSVSNVDGAAATRFSECES